MEATLNAPATRLSATQWLICAIAGVGFAFDMYEVVVQAIVVRPMLMELGGLAPGSVLFNRWAGIMLVTPAVVGGLASLGGGYLTDRLGRQRVLVWSIVLYALGAFCSGLATSLPAVAAWRCLAVGGACVEFIAAIAWLTELFPDTRRRDAVLGFSQACATIGNFLIAGAYYAAVTWGDTLPAVSGGHSAWRYALMFGALPAIPLMLVRPFLPESPVWVARRAAGTLQRPRIRELFEPALRRTTLVTIALVTCCYSMAYGMLQHIPRLVPGLPQVAELPRQQQEQWVSWVHVHVDVGALIGRIALALLVIHVVRRRPLLNGTFIAAFFLIPIVFLGFPMAHADVFKWAVMLVTLLMAMQHSFWGNYLPRVFPVHIRGTGEAFAVSFGGRVLAPFAALATTQLANVAPGATPTTKLAVSMTIVASLAGMLGLWLCRKLPEPGAELPQ